MARLSKELGEHLTYEEVKRLVEAASPSIELREDPIKGRYLVAKKPVKCGEVFLSEFPLFTGYPDAGQSKRACVQEFAELASKMLEEGTETDLETEDCLHPCSPLVDCLSCILLVKRQALYAEDKSTMARAKLRLRQFAALAKSSVHDPMPDDQAEELLQVFLPELRDLTDKDELLDMIHTISSNRFCGLEQQLDLMFAGSMFEHSCVPNCFAGNWNRSSKMPRLYRASEDIQVGDVLSISYLQMPDSYLPTSGRQALLSAWGFKCTCPRCTSLPELTRAFVCPSCSSSELCPPNAVSKSLHCHNCGKDADSEYATRCFELEEVLDKLRAGEAVSIPNGGKSNDIIGSFHHASFCESWRIMMEGPSPESLDRYSQSTEFLIEALTRLHGARDPSLLEFYHVMAALTSGNLEDQQHFLDLERECIRTHYPDISERQDQEIWNLVQGKGPHTAEPPINHTNLSGMD